MPNTYQFYVYDKNGKKLNLSSFSTNDIMLIGNAVRKSPFFGGLPKPSTVAVSPSDTDKDVEGQLDHPMSKLEDANEYGTVTYAVRNGAGGLTATPFPDSFVEQYAEKMLDLQIRTVEPKVHHIKFTVSTSSSKSESEPTQRDTFRSESKPGGRRHRKTKKVSKKRRTTRRR